MLFSERPPIYASSCMTISGGRTKQLCIFCCVTGFTSDFLSFIVVELIRFFHGALQLYYCKISCSKRGSVALWLRQWTSIQWTRVCFHCNPYESSVPPGRASGQNCSRAPEKYHFARGHFQAFVNEGEHNITVIAFSALRLLVWHQEGNLLINIWFQRCQKCFLEMYEDQSNP